MRASGARCGGYGDWKPRGTFLVRRHDSGLSPVLTRGGGSRGVTRVDRNLASRASFGRAEGHAAARHCYSAAGPGRGLPTPPAQAGKGQGELAALARQQKSLPVLHRSPGRRVRWPRGPEATARD
ncbi:hypothetical protein ACFFX0_05410 [Citricoccus parietis]|uniref:Uncharacterized protein n=1 Tax=Citricoccus parietis TaxID=592307 RepID=A0ABV5FVE2_9MICC